MPQPLNQSQQRSQHQPQQALNRSLHESKAVLAQDKPYKGGFYSGDEVNGQPNGNGTYTCDTYTYTGEFKDGKMHGKGTIEDFNNGIIYTGDLAVDEITGFGKYKYADGSEYEGSFLKGCFEGEGQFTL